MNSVEINGTRYVFEDLEYIEKHPYGYEGIVSLNPDASDKAYEVISDETTTNLVELLCKKPSFVKYKNFVINLDTLKKMESSPCLIDSKMDESKNYYTITFLSGKFFMIKEDEEGKKLKQLFDNSENAKTLGL